jgi:DNA-binding response OmpR family regulator
VALLRILVVEDHQDIADNILDFFRARGHDVTLSGDGAAGLQLALAGTFDAIVLDIMLPAMDGLAFCRKLREANHDTPVLMLTARDVIADKLEGFAAGADDYLTKPFSLDELSARVLAIHRRLRADHDVLLRVGDLELDPRTHLVRRGGRSIELNPSSFKILGVLMRASPNIVTKETLEAMLWGKERRAQDALRSQIYLLREAIDRPPASPMLFNAHGVGYRLAANDAS